MVLDLIRWKRQRREDLTIPIAPTASHSLNADFFVGRNPQSIDGIFEVSVTQGIGDAQGNIGRRSQRVSWRDKRGFDYEQGVHAAQYLKRAGPAARQVAGLRQGKALVLGLLQTTDEVLSTKGSPLGT